LCLGLTPLVRLVAVKKGWMAYPTKERWHKKPTALFGGCAIYAAVSIPLLVVADFRTIWSHIIRVSEGLELPFLSIGC
jgi:UDP-GlcNAc:undecaprenyl-phosphate GlcNAc-1-phosphate transferase